MSNVEAHDRIAALFRLVCDLPIEERDSALARVPATETERAAVKQLLRADALDEEFLAPPRVNAVALLEERTVIAAAPVESRDPVIQIPGYEILRELSRGGQGIVYQALQRSTQRKVAIKVLADGRLASDSDRRRFERECEICANLRHRNIVTVYDSGVTASGELYYVMDYVQGLSLDAFVRKNRLPLEDVLHLFIQVCRAVEHAHQNGVIHRDLKPNNILVDNTGEPKLLDFGLARPAGLAMGPHLSVSTEIVGTLKYMSPEHTRSATQVDARSDIYALGVILYELLTGRLPYDLPDDISAALDAIRSKDPRPASRSWDETRGILTRSGRTRAVKRCPLDRDIETILLVALAKDPGRRFQNVGELATDLELYLSNAPIRSRRDTWYVLRKLAYRNRVVSLALLSVLVILVSATIISGTFWRRAQAVGAQLAIRNEQLSEQVESEQSAARALREAIREEALGWVLYDWQIGREQAVQELTATSANSVRQLVRYLLTDEVSDEQLRGSLTGTELATANFFIGEKHFRQGDDDEARFAYRLALHLEPRCEWRARIEERLMQLGQTP